MENEILMSSPDKNFKSTNCGNMNDNGIAKVNDNNAHCNIGNNAGNNVNDEKRPCCACPDTRKARDECILAHGEEKCQKFINDHLECLRSLGFRV